MRKQRLIEVGMLTEAYRPGTRSTAGNQVLWPVRDPESLFSSTLPRHLPVTGMGREGENVVVG